MLADIGLPPVDGLPVKHVLSIVGCSRRHILHHGGNSAVDDPEAGGFFAHCGCPESCSPPSYRTDEEQDVVDVGSLRLADRAAEDLVKGQVLTGEFVDCLQLHLREVWV